MEHRTFLDALDAQKDAQDFLLATVLEGQQQGTALLLCDGQVAWTSAPETLLTQNLSALKKCTTSGVFTLGDTRVLCRAFWCRGAVGHLRRRTCSSGGGPAGKAAGYARYRAGRSSGICRCTAGNRGGSSALVRHLKRLWRRYRAVQRHTFVY